MCELMAVSFARPVSADFSIREFALRGEENASGWGLAWYPDKSLAIVKEPIAWHESMFTRFLENYTKARRVDVSRSRAASDHRRRADARRYASLRARMVEPRLRFLS
jgi:glutamine amidotransferase